MVICWPAIASDGGVSVPAATGRRPVKLLNERAQVREVAGKRRDQYPDPEYRLADGRRVGDILTAIKALDPETATAADVDATGARGWVAPRKCDECGEESWDAVELGEPPDYESCTATICERCLMAALDLIEIARYAEAWKAYRAAVARALAAQAEGERG